MPQLTDRRSRLPYSVSQPCDTGSMAHATVRAYSECRRDDPRCPTVFEDLGLFGLSRLGCLKAYRERTLNQDTRLRRNKRGKPLINRLFLKADKAVNFPARDLSLRGPCVERGGLHVQPVAHLLNREQVRHDAESGESDDTPVPPRDARVSVAGVGFEVPRGFFLSSLRCRSFQRVTPPTIAFSSHA